MAKIINVAFLKEVGGVERNLFPVKVARIFEYAGIKIAIHRPVNREGKVGRTLWNGTEITTGQAIGPGGWSDIESLIQEIKTRLDHAEKYNPGQMPRIIADSISKHGQANDPANLADAKAPPVSEYKAALRRILEIIDSGDAITESHYGSEIAAWRSLLE